MAMSDNSKRVLAYLKEATANGQQVTANDVATALGLTDKQVNGCFTMSIQKRSENKYGYRQESEVEEDGKHKTVKYLVLNEEGMALDPDAEPEKE